MKKLHSLLIILFSLSKLCAQPYALKAEVLDNKGERVELGNAVLLRPADSTLYAGMAFENGAFELKEINESPLLLRISAVGFETFYKTIANAAGLPLLDIGKIEMKRNQLKEVEVTAVIPLVQNEGDRKKVNVEGTMLNSAGSAMDVLEASPGLMVSGEGTVTVFGKGAAVVYLDGQRVPVELLRALPSDQIRYVEIIEHPPASYDAQGRAVINIVSKKNVLEGYQLNFTSNWSLGLKQQNLYSYDGASLLWKKRKISILTRYGMFFGRRWEKTEYLRDFESGGIPVTMRNTIETQNRFSGNHYFGGGVKYDIDSTRNVNFFYNGGLTQTDKTADDTNLVTMQATPYLIHAITKSKINGYNHNMSLDYTRRTDTLGGKRSGLISYSQFGNQTSGDIDESVSDSASSSSTPKRSSGRNAMHIVSAQADFAKTFGKKIVFENGAKLAGIWNGSSVGLERQSGNNGWEADSTINNAFDYSEGTAALYSQLQLKYPKWNMRAGLRGELTHTYGFSHRLNADVVDTTYFSLFPSLFAEYTLMKDLNLNGSYAFRIDRPDFSDLDPFITYIDSLSSLRGNPGLRPEYTQEASVALVYLEAASLELGYAHTRNDINTYVERIAGTNQFTGQERNFRFARNYSMDLEIPYENSWWTTSNGVGYSYDHAEYSDTTQTIVNARGLWYFYSYQAFRFLKRWSVEGIFQYNTTGAEGLFVGKPMYSLRTSLLYKSKESIFTVRLTCNDLLRSQVTIGESRIPGFDLTYKEYSDSFFLRLQLTWRIGKLKKADFNERPINQEERGRVK
ncbi:MAG: TonB-dependent receptor [Bacteroidetes bacterium]|nr:MAG: TonB-dependent receptor [Bacteroidota bacterium]